MFSKWTWGDLVLLGVIFFGAGMLLGYAASRPPPQDTPVWQR